MYTNKLYNNYIMSDRSKYWSDSSSSSGKNHSSSNTSSKSDDTSRTYMTIKSNTSSKSEKTSSLASGSDKSRDGSGFDCGKYCKIL